jgi:hypothetical protein
VAVSSVKHTTVLSKVSYHYHHSWLLWARIIIVSNVAIECLTLLLRIREFYHGPRPAIWLRVFVVFPSPAIQILGHYLKLGHCRFFHILTNSFFTSYPTVWQYIIWTIVSVDKRNYRHVCSGVWTQFNTVCVSCLACYLVDTILRVYSRCICY